MEVKIIYKDKGNGDALYIESHEIPEYAGRTMTETRGEGAGIDVTQGDIDLVADVVQSLHVSRAKGVYLSRHVVFGERARRMAGAQPPSGEQRVLVVRPERMADVERVVLDGETVWPEDAVDPVGDAFDRIAGIAGDIA
ncbi:MAG: hypothetical protein Q4A01_04255 [Coriobacteriales bacterium]|nr:hypothetical protein [Coriobacteriales bacterium]